MSIFPKAKPLPANKEEKNYEAKFASRPHFPEIVEVNTEDDIINVVTQFCWSPSIFKKSRLLDEFVSTDFLVLDIDNNLTIEESYKRIEEAGVACLCLPSTSHQPNAHRFRLILPLSRTITKLEDFEASMEDLCISFPEADPVVKANAAAFYFGSTTVDGYWFEGSLLEPLTAPEPIKSSYDGLDRTSSIPVDATLEELVIETYGELRTHIPEAVAFFMREGHTGLPGMWNVTLNKAVYILGLQGVEEETVEDLVAHVAPSALDKSDMNTIRRSWRDGQRDRE